MNRPAEEQLTVLSVASRRPQPSVRRTQPALFAGLMAVALGLAAGAGLLLGFLAGVQAGIGETHWTQTVQAHGRIQVWAFTAVFVTTLAVEFMSRFNQRQLPAKRWRIVAAILLAVGPLLAAAGAVEGRREEQHLLVGGLATTAGAAIYGWLLLSLARRETVRHEVTTSFFLAGAFWLVVAALIGVLGAIDSVGPVTPLAETRAMHEVALRGFVLSTIVAVGLRALPGHAGTNPLSVRHQWWTWGLLHASVLTWLAGSGVIDEWHPDLATRLGNGLLAFTVVLFTAWTGMFQRPPRWLRGEPANLLIRLAWIGVLVWAAMLATAALWDGFLSAQREGAMRHAFTLGFMAPLMLAFAQIVLARFGVGHLSAGRTKALTFAFALVFVASPLRIVAGLWLDEGALSYRWAMGAAGVLTMGGLAVAGLVCASVALQLTQARRAHSTGGATRQAAH